MKVRSFLSAATIAAALCSTTGIALAQGMMMQGGTDHPRSMMQGDISSRMMPGTSQGDQQTRTRSDASQGPMCSSGSCPCMSGSGMCSGMMGSAMTDPMQSRTMTATHPMMQGILESDSSKPYGSYVVPPVSLTVDDVKSYLNSRLEKINNKRLKLGEVRADDRTITADIVTVDNSVVQRLQVNRRTGEIDYRE